MGCGIGGGDFYMARAYGCYVYGIDLSVNAVLSALERAAASGNHVKVRRGVPARLAGMSCRA